MRSNSRRPKFHRTLAFRLTLWYAVFFAVTSCLAFFSFYFLMASILKTRTDDGLMRQVDELLTMSEFQDVEAVQQMVTAQAQAAGERELFIRVLYPTGLVFSSSNMAYWRRITVDRQAVRELLSGVNYVFRDVYLRERAERVRVIYGLTPDKIILQVGQSITADNRILETFRKYFLVSMTFLIFVAAGFGWFMARRATSGLAAVIGTARQISKDDLNGRVPLRGLGDEIDQLAFTFNQMLDRIGLLVSGMREMSDNIAHDLKSPVTHIRGIAEVTLINAQSISDYEQMAGQTIEACDRLLSMINTMLAISESEAGAGRLNYEMIDLTKMLEDACDLFAPLLEDKGIKMNLAIAASLELNGDKPKLQRVLANLIDNAIKYTNGGGHIEIRAEKEEGGEPQAKIMVKDSGIGISSEEIPFIFDRFYRCDQSRPTSGAGLGLSLARAFARAHGGDILVESEPNEGSLFLLVLPLNPMRPLSQMKNARDA